MPRILVVDDSRTINKLVSTTLSNAGYNVISCHDVDSAIEQLKEYCSSVRIVITDLIMPGKDGIDLIDHIHQNSLIGTRPRIIAISGGSTGTVNAETALKSVEGRVESVLMKPFSQNALIKAVEMQLQ